MRYLFFTMVITLSFANLNAQVYRNFEELDSLQAIEKRKVMVFIHTDWCNFCQTMKKKVFKDPAIEKRLDEEFYFVELNGESETPIRFRGYEFKYIPSGNGTGVHQLAQELGTINGVLNYPTTVVLNSEYGILVQYDAFLNKKGIRKLMNEMKKVD